MNYIEEIDKLIKLQKSSIKFIKIKLHQCVINENLITVSKNLNNSLIQLETLYDVKYSFLTKMCEEKLELNNIDEPDIWVTQNKPNQLFNVEHSSEARILLVSGLTENEAIEVRDRLEEDYN